MARRYELKSRAEGMEATRRRIVEASTVYGETDVICRVQVPDQPRLDQLVMRDLHAIPAVESTRTFIVVHDMHWRREG